MSTSDVTCELGHVVLGRIVAGIECTIREVQAVIPTRRRHGWIPSSLQTEMTTSVSQWVIDDVRLLVMMLNLYADALSRQIAHNELEPERLVRSMPFLEDQLAGERERFERENAILRDRLNKVHEKVEKWTEVLVRVREEA